MAQKHRNGTKPLVTAAERGNVVAVDALLTSGYEGIEERADDGSTALIRAASNGHKYIVKALLAAGANKDAKAKVSQGDGPHHSLADTLHDLPSMPPQPSSGLPQMGMTLSSKISANKDAKTSVNGSTALIRASAESHEGCVRLLVQAGAERSLKDKYGRTAINWAVTEDESALRIASNAIAIINEILFSPVLALCVRAEAVSQQRRWAGCDEGRL